MDKPLLFDTERRRLNLIRATANFRKHDFLFKKTEQSIEERLSFIKRDFRSILLIDDHSNSLFDFLNTLYPKASIKYFSSSNIHMLKQSNFDCIINLLTLHWDNDISNTLNQCHSLLKPDGVFIASLFGNETLKDLRHSFIEVESELYQSITPHIAPAIDIKSLGLLMQKAGFEAPVMDCEDYTVLHQTLLSLFHDLRGMGENNALHSPARMITRNFLKQLEENYAGKTRQNDGFLATRFDVLYAIGWKKS